MAFQQSRGATLRPIKLDSDFFPLYLLVKHQCSAACSRSRPLESTPGKTCPAAFPRSLRRHRHHPAPHLCTSAPLHLRNSPHLPAPAPSMAFASVPTPTMFSSRDLLATTDPAAATESFNLLEDSFAHSFLRSRNPARAAQTSLSPRMPGLYNPSPRLPSALPPSASPRVVEPLTPDRSQPVLPFYSAEDIGDLPPAMPLSPRSAANEAAREAERNRRVEWARALPSLPRAPATAIGVVDEDAADRMFSSVPRRQSRPHPVRSPLIALSAPEPRPHETDLDQAMPNHPAMHLNLAPLRPSSSAPSISPLAAVRELSPSVWGVSPPLPENRGSGGPSPSQGFGREIIGSWAGQVRGAKQPELPDLALPVKRMSEPARLQPSSSPGMPASIAAFLASTRTSSVSAEDSAPTPLKKPRRPDMSEYSKMEDVVQALSSVTEDLRLPQVPQSMLMPMHHMQAVQPLQAPVRHTPPRARRATRPRPARTDAQAKAVGADPLQCHLCRQRFARRSNLFKHLRSVHEEVRRFACTACPFKFKRQDHLLKHTRSVHAKVRKFSCDICGIGFAEKFNRDKHTRSIHHTKRAFRCGCGAYFQDRDKMLSCLRCKRLPPGFQ